MIRITSLAMLGGLLLLDGCAQGAQQTPAPRVAASAAAGQVKAVMVNTSECAAADLKLSFDGRDGDFTGMSHDGALLTLKNTGSETCTLPRRPLLQFTDAAGKSLALHAHVPPGMHPGPVMVPVKVAPGTSVQGKMRWVTGPVYDTNTCIDTAQASLAVRGGDIQAPFKAHVCGPSPDKLEYEQEFMQPS